MRKSIFITVLLLTILVAACAPASAETKQKINQKSDPTLETMQPPSDAEADPLSTTEPTESQPSSSPTNPSESTATAESTEIQEPTQAQEQETGTDNDINVEAPYIQAAMRDLMFRFNLSVNDIAVLSVEKVDWSDASLGCPLVGAVYAQLITPGCVVTLRALEEIYTYHTDENVLVVLCGEEGTPILPNIPIPKDEDIKDGIPWVPVD